jgi:hypothetical protein
MEQSMRKMLVHPAAIERYVSISWDFVCRHLWLNVLLDAEQCQFAQLQLRIFYLNVPPERFTEFARHYYADFCVKVLEIKAQIINTMVTFPECLTLK